MDKRLVPELLLSESGEKVLTKEQWYQKRRPEVVELFEENVYGRAPLKKPENINFEVVKKTETMDGKAVLKMINISFSGPGGSGNIPLTLFVPANSDKPVPAFLLINNRDESNANPERDIKSPFWPAENIIKRGYATAVFQVADVDPDYYDGFKDGVHGIFGPFEEPRPGNAWGTISAWAWGASRVMDYLEMDSDIYSKRVALVGHSRGGKTALWCGAQDERFSIVVSNNSGCTGAAIARGKVGENIRIINNGFPHWFCGNYKKYNDREYELPVDQHMLISLIAPRHVYVTSATEDSWADPQSEFLSCVYAEEAYKLFGFTGLGIENMPFPDSPVFGDHMAYHLRTGRHDLTEYDWDSFMNYADKWL